MIYKSDILKHYDDELDSLLRTDQLLRGRKLKVVQGGYKKLFELHNQHEDSVLYNIYPNISQCDYTKGKEYIRRPDFEVKSALGKYQYKGQIDEMTSRPYGKGEAFFSDGRYYKGEFVDGNLTGKDAYFRYPNGDEFNGSFKNNAFNEGTYTVAEDGSYFKGTFKNGQPDKGTWYDKNGKIIE